MKFRLLLCALFLLSGCGDMFAQSVVVLIGGAQYSHEYYLHYTADFEVGGYPVHLDRYGDVRSVYENFNGQKCDRSKSYCWLSSNSFLAGLPNGDIILIGGSTKIFDQSLSTLKPGETQDITLHYSIYRDRPLGYGPMKDQMSCQFITKDVQTKVYGWPPLLPYEAVSEPPVDVKAERVDSIPMDQDVLDRQLKISSSMSGVHPMTCESILAQYQ